MRKLLALLCLILFLAPISLAAPSKSKIVKFGEDVNIPVGSVVNQVVAIGGSITVAGTVQEDVVAHLDFFREPKRDEQPQGVPQMFMGPSPEDPLKNYRVNLLVDNSQTKGAPIIIETSPSYRNLFGTIER